MQNADFIGIGLVFSVCDAHRIKVFNSVVEIGSLYDSYNVDFRDVDFTWTT